MNDAQLGLIVATPIIIIFAVVLRRIGALRTSGTVAALVVAAVIAIILFLTQ